MCLLSWCRRLLDILDREDGANVNRWCTEEVDDDDDEAVIVLLVVVKWYKGVTIRLLAVCSFLLISQTFRSDTRARDFR